MQFLKTFERFSNVKDYYERIPASEAYDVIKQEWTDNERSKVISTIKGNKAHIPNRKDPYYVIEVTLKNPNIKSRIKSAIKAKTNKYEEDDIVLGLDLSVYKSGDEWYYVKIVYQRSPLFIFPTDWYKCDQFDGLLMFLKNIVNNYNWKMHGISVQDFPGAI